MGPNITCCVDRPTCSLQRFTTRRSALLDERKVRTATSTSLTGLPVAFVGFVYVDGGENNGDAAFTPIPGTDKVREDAFCSVPVPECLSVGGMLLLDMHGSFSPIQCGRR